MKKDIVNETFKKHLKLLHEHLNINEYSPFEGQNSSDFDKIKHKLSPQQIERIKNLDRSGFVTWVFTHWDDENQILSIESIDTHEMRRSPLNIDKEGKTMTDGDFEQMRNQNLKKYPDPKKLSIREGHSPEVENYYRLVKAGKIPEKQAKEVANLIQNYDYGYQVDDYNEVYQYVTLYAPPNHGNIQDQPGFGGIVHVDKDGKHIDDNNIEKMRKQNLKQYPKDRIKPSIREVE